MKPLTRIRARREPLPTEVVGYRSPSESARARLTLSWSAFVWFDLLWLVLVGAPIIGVIALVSSLTIHALWPAVVVALWMVASLFDRVVIHVSAEGIRSRLWPIPIWPSKLVMVEPTTLVIATQRDDKGATNAVWYVCARAPDATVRMITRRLRRRDEAVFVARAIEEHLGLGPGAAFDGAEGDTSTDD